MSTRPDRKQLTSLQEILEALGDPDKVGKNQVWVGNNYSLKDLIQDLQHVGNKSGNGAG